MHSSPDPMHSSPDLMHLSPSAMHSSPSSMHSSPSSMHSCIVTRNRDFPPGLGIFLWGGVACRPVMRERRGRSQLTYHNVTSHNQAPNFQFGTFSLGI